MNSKIYQVVWESEALKWLANKIDKITARKLYEKTNRDLSLDPVGKGKRLVGKWKGYLSYRYTIHYRVIYEILDHEVLVSVVRVAHRREVYD
jgi:mRNA interferase RelE/StbE